MKENYITLFDYNYLPQGLTMYKSLKSNFNNFNLWIVCMDKKVENFFKKKKFKEINIIPLKDIENSSLLAIKKKRKFVEYCWTLTPFLPSYIFKKRINKITYIDADIFFYKKPSKIIKEFQDSKKSVFITEHGFHKNFDYSSVSGRFCVQYIIFKNNRNSKKILKWWQKKCLEWCHDYPDNNRLGDQKYLDQWPELFGNHIHISKNKKYFQAPWTFDRFNCKDTIIYHFHGLKISHNKVFVYNRYGLNHKIINYIYSNYIKALSKTIRDLGLTFNQLKETNDFKHKMKNLLVRFNILQTKKTKFYFDLD